MDDVQLRLDQLRERASQRPDLIAGAEAAYDRNDQSWFDSQSQEDLVFLWDINPWGMNFSWDDEVYEALFARGYFPSEALRQEPHINNQF